MSTTTSIQLAEYSTSAAVEPAKTTATRRRVPQASDDDETAILEASRAADSEAPDGGYGWAVVAGGAILLWWGSGTTYAWGVMQRQLVQEGLAGPAVLSFIGSLQAAMIATLAIVNTALMRKLGPRTMAMIGMTLMGVSEIISSWTYHSVPGLFITFGVMTGVGARYVITEIWEIYGLCGISADDISHSQFWLCGHCGCASAVLQHEARIGEWPYFCRQWIRRRGKQFCYGLAYSQSWNSHVLSRAWPDDLGYWTTCCLALEGEDQDSASPVCRMVSRLYVSMELD